jgi:CheY-like chemotaxis protein
MRILIVDDSIVKISELTKVIVGSWSDAQINSTNSIQNTIELINESARYDLLIVDVELPLRIEDIPKKNGGQILLSEIERKIESNKTPRYIVGFTQYGDLSDALSDIWRTVIYDPSTSGWSISISKLLNHISKITFGENLSEVLPTLFVEGVTDKIILQKALEYFYPDKQSLFNISTAENAGANWVASQIAIWAISLKKDCNKNYIQSLGLLDSDEAGNKAKLNIAERIVTENEQSTFKILQLSPSYNKELIEFYKHGCKIEIEIESLFNSKILNKAKEFGWLEHRRNTFIENPKNWKQYEHTSLGYVESLGINEELHCHVMKVKVQHKKEFTNYVNTLPKEQFINFKKLLEDIFDKLGIEY